MPTIILNKIDESTIEDVTAEMKLTTKQKQLTQAGQAF